MKKGFSCLLLALLFSLLTLLPALAFMEPSGAFYVTDKAEVLTPTTENKIISQNELLYEETGAQIVVVTMSYLDEEDYRADEYAVQLMKDWGLNDGEKNNGMLLLLVTEEGKAWLTTGDGINADLNNEKVSTLLSRWFWKKFDSGDYDGAVSDLFDRLIDWYEDYYDFRLGNGIQSVDTEQQGQGGLSPILVIILIVIVVISIFRSGFFGIITPRRRTWGFGPGSGYSRGPSYRSGGSYRSGSWSSGGSHGGFSSGSKGGFSSDSHSHSGGGGRSGGGGAGRR